MAQHTKGPWHAVVDDGRTIIYDETYLARHIAYLSYGGVPEEQEWPNAILLAAAPDLLAMARALIDMLDPADDWDHPTVIAARAVIAKATGEIAA